MQTLLCILLICSLMGSVISFITVLLGYFNSNFKIKPTKSRKYLILFFVLFITSVVMLVSK